MKRIMVFWLILLLPVLVMAKEYESQDIKIKLDINDDYIVLTRTNLDNNSDLEKLNITKEQMNNIMVGNNIYFDIIKNDISYEILIIVPKTMPLYDDLTSATEEELAILKDTIVEETGDLLPIVYKNEYAYVVVDYHDGNNYVMNYYTVVNSRGYNIQMQKKTEITEEDKEDLKEIVDSIKFIDNNKKKSQKKSFDYKIIIYSVLIGLLAGIITYFISDNITKKKKKHK